MRMLVTGAAGSLGRQVVVACVDQGDSVRAFDLPQCDFAPLEMPGVEVLRGDIGDDAAIRDAVAGVDVVLHLAALLPPASERSRDLTFAVNVEGTRRVVEAMRATARRAHLVLSSSVVTYGDTSRGLPPVGVDHPQPPQDLYGESKVQAEQVVMGAGLSFTVLRISGIAVPALLEPPEVWPFQAEQRLEFVSRHDAVLALLAATRSPAARNRVFNVAGGTTWRMRGIEYAAQILTAMDMAPEEARYLDEPGSFDWYDTVAGQDALGYQKTTFPQFLEQLRAAVAAALA